MAVKILIDSASDITKAEAEKLGVDMISMQVTFGDEEFYDGVDLLPDTFYQKLKTCPVMPKTSLITPFRFEEEFERLTANGDEVIVITISSRLSGTYESAKNAAENFKGKVYAIDSMSAATGERLLCLYALDLIKQNYSAKEIAQKLEVAKDKLVVLAMLDTLEYLKKGGRISATTAFVGSMLSIKPVVRVIDGEVKMAGKARGVKKGKEFLTSVIEQTGVDTSMPYGVIYSDTSEEDAEKYAQEVSYLFDGKTDALSYAVGSTIGTHVGPGVIGVAYFQK